LVIEQEYLGDRDEENQQIGNNSQNWNVFAEKGNGLNLLK
jgi:hypothetical protein